MISLAGPSACWSSQLYHKVGLDACGVPEVNPGSCGPDSVLGFPRYLTNFRPRPSLGAGRGVDLGADGAVRAELPACLFPESKRASPGCGRFEFLLFARVFSPGSSLPLPLLQLLKLDRRVGQNTLPVICDLRL